MIDLARQRLDFAFGGRASMRPGAEVLNSPGTIYERPHAAGLDATKAAIRKSNYCVLVEGILISRRSGGRRRDGGVVRRR